MDSQLIKMLDFGKRTLNLDEKTMNLIVAQVFAERKGSYLNEFNLYLAYYHTIPNFIHEINIDCKRANKWFTNAFKTEIKDWYYNKRYFNDSNKLDFDDIFYFLYEDLMVDFDTNYGIVRFLFRMTDIDKVEKIRAQIKKFKERKPRHKPMISLLVETHTGLDTVTMDITSPKFKIEDNYNDDFLDIHKAILKRLSKKNDKGMVLLHGMPGTGKTSYIRYLISQVKKEIIYLPPNMAGSISNPDLIGLFIKKPNSILVIEDAENIVFSREIGGNSRVSALLNLSDGLLSDCLNIQIICTFNTDITNIDKALLRKGRLIANYEFRELEVPKAVSLSKKLGFNSEITAPTTLTAIYNRDEKDFQIGQKRNPIGFVV